MQPRFNIAPTQTVDFAHLDKAGNIELNQGRWWLVSPRCLIPADAYFEWTVNAEDGKKDPWLLQMPDGAGFSFAGIWAHNDNLGVTSCTIITAPTVPGIEHIHTRMPVSIETAQYERWLSGEDHGDQAKALPLGSQIDSRLMLHRVNRSVINSRYEGNDTKKLW